MEEGIQKLKLDFIVIGNQNTGKTSLIKRYVTGDAAFTHFYTPTIGLNLEKKIVTIGNKIVTLCIWDTAGQEKFFSLTKGYFKKADGVLIIFDLTDSHTFDRIEKYWIEQIKEKSEENCIKVMIGNKADCLQDRKVKYEQAKGLADRYGIKYFQTSAKTGVQVDDAFMSLAKDCSSVIPMQKGNTLPASPLQPIQKKNWNLSCLGRVRGLFSKSKESE